MSRLAVLLTVLALGVRAAPLLAGPPTAPAFTAADHEFFEKKVRPVLVQRCYACHSTQARKVRGGLLLYSRAALRRGGNSGPAALARPPPNSLLLIAGNYTHQRL